MGCRHLLCSFGPWWPYTIRLTEHIWGIVVRHRLSTTSKSSARGIFINQGLNASTDFDSHSHGIEFMGGSLVLIHIAYQSLQNLVTNVGVFHLQCSRKALVFHIDGYRQVGSESQSSVLVIHNGSMLRGHPHGNTYDK